MSLKKTAHYRRASQTIGEGDTLQHSLDVCKDGYPAAAYPAFPFKNGVDAIVASHERDRFGRDYLHLVTFEEGAGAAVIQTIRRAGVAEEPAPHEKQFIQSQVYIVCRGNDVVYTTHNSPVRDSSVSVLLNKLLGAFGPGELAYLLTATLDERRYRAMMQDGIEEIDLDVGGYRSTLEYLSGQGQLPDAGLFSMLKSLVSDDATPAELQAAESIMGRLTLRPGRAWGQPQVRELMLEMAEEVLDDGHDEGFAIVTKSGVRITRDSVRVRDDFRVDGNRRVIDTVQVRTALTEAFDHFDEIGIFEN
ncbi:hypothetical protein [Sulfitobacter sp.]|uniref:hypothetical protein n=1 Tax=Sulfitobacter sp. TaxID=1903071 RepID=UPI00272D7A84|nr:hypothetical protein [Sulfitobacter sp.]